MRWARPIRVRWCLRAAKSLRSGQLTIQAIEVDEEEREKMGADLILAFAEIEKGKDPNWDAAADHINAGGWLDDDEVIVDLLGLFREESGWDDDARSRVHSALENVMDMWARKYRDAGVLHLKHTDLLVSGGMSWGDSPTDSYDDIMLLRVTGALEAAGFY